MWVLNCLESTNVFPQQARATSNCATLWSFLMCEVKTLEFSYIRPQHSYFAIFGRDAFARDLNFLENRLPSILMEQVPSYVSFIKEVS